MSVIVYHSIAIMSHLRRRGWGYDTWVVMIKRMENNGECPGFVMDRRMCSVYYLQTVRRIQIRQVVPTIVWHLETLIISGHLREENNVCSGSHTVNQKHTTRNVPTIIQSNEFNSQPQSVAQAFATVGTSAQRANATARKLVCRRKNRSRMSSV